MNWVAVVPLKQGQNPKSRLAAILSPSARIGLSLYMAKLVIEALRLSDRIDQILLLSPVEPPPLVGTEWSQDKGRGVNQALSALRGEMPDRAMLVINADVPLVGAVDIAAMIRGAEEHGRALAPDRHDAGTNAVALMPDRVFPFAFGRHSFATHCAEAPDATVIRRLGLMLDIDTPNDLEIANAAGFRTP